MISISLRVVGPPGQEHPRGVPVEDGAAVAPRQMTRDEALDG